MEIYVSTDVEADGPVPGTNSMLSFASAAYTAEGKLLGTFSANLETLPGATANPKTAEWWLTQPEAWAACRRDPQPPEVAMREYAAWVGALPGKPVFVAYPAGFDFVFVYWYLMRFVGQSPFGFSAIDIKSYAMALLKTEYRHATKSRLPAHWFGTQAHTHIALDDAIEQGTLFCNMLAENLGRP
ncbi:MAG TPA: 3'-5' exoribonuclease [Gammaproteobacteria bacterium]|nr:3'-5' exoribonuclease [Gammaproteobacteria bacterium]